MISWCVERSPALVHRDSGAGIRACIVSAYVLLMLPTAFVVLPAAARAHVPLPESVLNPQTEPEAWNVLRLAAANIERLVHEDRLGEVPDQASLCSPALRTIARLAATTPRQKEITIGTVRAASAVDSLAQGCVAGDRASVNAALMKLRTALDALAVGTDPQVTNADIFSCPMHPDVVSADGKALCPKCGMALSLRRIPYSFVYVAPPGEASMQLTASADGPLQGDRPAHVKIRLTTRDGSPVAASDLLVAHTQRIHLLIIDPALEDYHHEHPVPTSVPGEYEFTFTPTKSSPYRIYADVVPALTGIQEYIPVDLPGIRAPNVHDAPSENRQGTFTAEVDGLHFQLALDGTAGRSLRSRQAQTLRISVSDADGRPLAQLEPVMNAFAHLVGFYDDGRTVVHLHPAGPDIIDMAARGGPSLEFRFYPPKEGFLRLYCQVSIGGKMIFVPFGVNILP